jgi:putative Holliday junction resolvase
MPRLMALDVSEKRIGIALTDESGAIVTPHSTLVRQPGRRRDMAALRSLIAEYNVSEIVVGLPIRMGGEHGAQAAKIEAFVRDLRGSVRIPIELEDERLTTAEAKEMLAVLSSPRRRDETKLDAFAAALILESYLGRRSAGIAAGPSGADGETESEKG